MKQFLFALLLIGSLAGCRRPSSAPDELHGYAEADWTHLAAPTDGYLLSLNVRRGDTVVFQQPAAQLDPEPDTLAHQAAQARVAEAEARLVLAEKQHQRARDLFSQRVSSQGDWDEATEKLSVARRSLDAARRLAEESAWKVRHKTLLSPVNGWVHETYFTPGEWVPAGRPVVTLLAPENIYARAFAPQSIIATLAVGGSATLETSEKKSLPARITKIGTVAEYVPPVLYARDTRDHLMFALELRPDHPDRHALRPGEPVTVRLEISPAP
jgi:HlyD family secretion protein